jgi:arylsulfatase A-like enzyme
MKKRTIIVALVIAIILFAVAYYWLFSHSSKFLSRDHDKRYNVILIVSDALRQDVLSCYGGDVPTPNIDWLAENGVLFENAYNTSPWTPPSAVSMLTGNYATSYGFIEHDKIIEILVPDSEKLCAEYLQEFGYKTTMKNENPQAYLHNNTQGFYNMKDVSFLWSPTKKLYPADKMMVDSICGIVGVDSPHGPGLKKSFSVLWDLLLMLPEDKFLILDWIIDPHVPYLPADKFRSKIKVNLSKLPKREILYESAQGIQYDYTEEEKKYIVDLYKAEIESVDERIGFVIKMLGHKNLLDNTYIVFTSDHGELFGEHDFYGHAKYYYEDLLKVPLIISGPGLQKGKKIKSRVTNLNMIPTIKDLLNVDYEDVMQGQSFMDLLIGKDKKDGHLYFDDVRKHTQIDAIIENNFKLICLEGQKFELYDLTNDPEEEQNLTSSRPELVEFMYEKILEIRKNNELKRKENMAALTDDIDKRSEEEKKALLQRLKSLGYLK